MCKVGKELAKRLKDIVARKDLSTDVAIRQERALYYHFQICEKCKRDKEGEFYTIQTC